MNILPTNARVKFGFKDTITGKIVGHGTMVSRGETIFTYAIELDEKYRGYIAVGDSATSFISTMLVNVDNVTKI